MVYLMILIYGIALSYNIIYKKKWINTLFFTLAPYAIITFINNVFMTKLGYLKVSDEVIFLIIVALIPLSTGMAISNIFFKLLYGKSTKYCSIERSDAFDEKANASIESISGWIVICCFLRLLQLFTIYAKYGLSYVAQFDFYAFGLQGIISHLFLTIYPFAGIVLYYGIKNKSKKHIIIFLMGVIVAALSFIKYHAILYVLFAFFYCVTKNGKFAKKLGFICLGTVMVIFIGNYIIGFAIRGITEYGIKDYLYKIWDYIGGSLINCNYSITEQGLHNYTWSDLLYSSLTPVINMFSQKILKKPLNVKSFPMGFKAINYNGNMSNVMSLVFVNLYTGSWVYFMLYLVFLGFVVEWIIHKIEFRKNDNLLTFYVMLLTISILTFFANYFELSAIWEITIWSLLIPPILLNNKLKIKLKSNASNL